MEDTKATLVIKNILKGLSFALLVLAFAQMYVLYPIDLIQMLPTELDSFITILRTLTFSAVALGFISGLFENHSVHLVSSIFGIVIGTINLLFLKETFIGWGKGNPKYPASNGFAYTDWRATLFIIECVLLVICGVLTLFRYIKTKEYKYFNVFYTLLTVISFVLGFINPHFLEKLNTMWVITDDKTVPKDFNSQHVVLLCIVIFLYIALQSLLFRKDKQTKRLVLLTLSLAGAFCFFNVSIFNQNGVLHGNLPLHLCNTAIILCFIAYAFELSGVFYFTFFVNVLGCLFAMLMPNYGDTCYWYTYENFRFWMPHIYCCVLPILGMTLKMFERPKIKSMIAAIIIFTLYVLIAIVCNSWFSNYSGVNYFFLNDDFLFEKLSMPTDLKNNYVWEFEYNGLVFRIFPLFALVVYVIFVGLMFVVWYVYDFLFQVADSHKAIHYKKKLLQQNYIDFKKELNGRSIHEPLVTEDIGMIEIKNFTKVYSGSTAHAVDNLNLTINDGEVYGFLGHNGAGKSTTIKSLVGIQTITSGQMVVDGYDVAKQPVEAKLRIGYVSDNHAVYERLTGREYINYIADLYQVSQKDRDERIDKYTKMFKLEDAIDREIKSYSHGMKQKIVVIASLIHDPKVWVLDEPLTGLDPTSAYQIKECMREHASRGNIVFFSSHVIEVVEKICTKICIISHGKLCCEYSLKDLKKKGISLEELYLKYVTNEERKD